MAQNWRDDWQASQTAPPQDFSYVCLRVIRTTRMLISINIVRRPERCGHSYQGDNQCVR